jgi:mono/diheme cytochrome c family protein
MHLVSVLLGLALAVASLSCGGEERAAPGVAQPRAADLAPAEASPAGAAAEDPGAPVGTISADPARGRALYATYCASCHGPGGDGDGPVAAGLDPKPAKHSDGRYMNALSDAHLFRVIQEGGPAVGKSPLMAPWGGTLGDQQIHDLVAFVRSLADPPYPGG